MQAAGEMDVDWSVEMVTIVSPVGASPDDDEVQEEEEEDDAEESRDHLGSNDAKQEAAVQG